MSRRIKLDCTVRATTADTAIRAVIVPRKVISALAEGSSGAFSAEDAARIRGLVPATRFKGKAGESLPVGCGDGRCLWLVGCGSDDTRAIRRAAAAATKLVPEATAWSLDLGLDPAPDEHEAQARFRAMAEGVQLGPYRFRLSAERKDKLAGPCSLGVPEALLAAAERLLERTASVSEGVLLTRDLVNRPANELGPEELSDAAVEVARRHGFPFAVYTGDEVEHNGFRLVHAVGRASTRPPTVTVVRTGPPRAVPALALVGKGVAFDTGGLNLKKGAGMELMRKDMAGAGTVIGILDALGRIGGDVPLLAVLPSAENAVAGDSYRPGDIVRSYSGKTVYIGNTDAEGRLLLADGIEFARAQGARRVLDLATLTGSARVALGTDVAALFGTDEELVADLLKAGAATDEALWRMPLVDDYDKRLDIPFADMNNVANNPRGGAIVAALFLKRFTGETPWAHLDFYGWEDNGHPGSPKGATGELVRTVTEVAYALRAE